MTNPADRMSPASGKYYDRDGNIVYMSDAAGKSNRELFSETITFAASDSEESGDIPVPASPLVLIYAKNDTGEDATLILQNKMGEEYIDYIGADHEDALLLPDDTARVFGPVEGWPRFDGGRIVVQLDGAESGDVDIIVQEV